MRPRSVALGNWNLYAHLDLTNTFTIKLVEYFLYRFSDLKDLKPETTHALLSCRSVKSDFIYPRAPFGEFAGELCSFNLIWCSSIFYFNNALLVKAGCDMVGRRRVNGILARFFSSSWIGLLLSARITGDHPVWCQEIQLGPELGQIVWLETLNPWRVFPAAVFFGVV